MKTAGRWEHKSEEDLSTQRKPKAKTQAAAHAHKQDKLCITNLPALQIKCLPKLSRPQKVLNYCHHIFSSLFLAREKKHLKDSHRH